ncbi:MAG: ABC transporter permease [Steroidobacteraceae bacterium]
MASSLSQVGVVTTLNLRTLVTRWQSAAVTVVGIAGVMIVLTGVFSMYEGFRATLDLSGSDEVALILRGGSTDEMSSGLALEDTRIAGDAPGVARSAGAPIVSAEMFVNVGVPSRATGTEMYVPMRGVGPQAPRLRGHFRWIAGHMINPGTNEIVVGQAAARQFRGLELGNRIKLGVVTWSVVGIFSDAGSISESEIWADTTTMQGIFQYGTGVQSIRARLTSPAAIKAYKDSLGTDPRVNFKIQTEREYLTQMSSLLRGVISSVGFAIALLMGIGAVFAALNTMYAAVAARTREIATLRALGFGAFPVIVSVLAEALVLGLSGAVIGGAIGYLAFNGIQTSTLNMASFSQVAFSFRVTGELLLWGCLYALVLAFIGGVLPAIRAARLPIAGGLREL